MPVSAPADGGLAESVTPFPGVQFSMTAPGWFTAVTAPLSCTPRLEILVFATVHVLMVPRFSAAIPEA